MAIILSVQQLEKSFGAQQLFRNISFGIEDGDRIGLIGPNGAGKSTLLKILAGLASADDGEVVRRRGLRIGYLAQAPELAPDKTIYEILSDDIDDPTRLGSVYEWMARLSLEGETLIRQLSGGWKKRVALARELITEPDLLLLDEPTNHLDVESILWLEDLLRDSSFATLTVTHDRLFLERVATRILDLDRRNPDGLLAVNGPYTAYVEAKDVLMHMQEKREDVVRNTLRRETEWLRRGAKARQTKQQARIERAGQLSEEADDLYLRNQKRKARIDFESAERNPQKLIEATGIVKSYGDKKLFGPVDILVSPKTRLGLLGPNGAGKSTIIRILLGEESPDQGSVQRAERLQVAYFAQHRDELKPQTTVLRTICPEGDYVNYRGQYVFARSYLDRFLFRREQVDMPVEKLSGGEKSRLRIAQLMLEKANILVLDEPTNDLDLDTLHVLEESIGDFDGAVILVSHDRYFLDQVATEILAFTESSASESHLLRFAGYAQWESWLAEGAKAPLEKSKAQAVEKSANKRRLSFNEKRELEGMETTILKEEERLRALQEASGSPENVANAKKLAELFTEIGELEARIEKLYARWSELEAAGN